VLGQGKGANVNAPGTKHCSTAPHAVSADRNVELLPSKTGNINAKMEDTAGRSRWHRQEARTRSSGPVSC
jgi:hypothetical protein